MWPELLSLREGVADFQKFIGGCSVDGERFYSYTRPHAASMLFLVAIGGGGAGGVGFTDIAGNDKGGGGGGSGGNITRLFIPWRYLPQTLFLTVGNPVSSATNGIASRVLVAPDTTLATANHVLKATGGNKGSDGTGVAGGSAGSAPTANASTDGPWLGLGTWTAIQGQVGSVGGAHTGGSGGTVNFGANGTLTSGGTGGGGTTGSGDFIAGTVSANAGINPSTPGGQLGGAANANGAKAPSGIAQWQNTSSWPGWLFTGGAGGGSDDDALGGLGGDGAIGCGGGGGGAGATGGIGGKGGAGMIVLVSF